MTTAWGTALETTGADVQAGDLPWNAALAPGGSTVFGITVGGGVTVPTLSCATS